MARLTASAKATAVRRSFMRRRKPRPTNETQMKRRDFAFWWDVMMRATIGFALTLTLTVSAASAQSQKPTLDIYIVDVEGGKATLFVSPSGESALIDTGSPGDRDVDRIMAAISDAGLEQIDYLISTHYHGDHIGGMQELAKRIPIRHFIDHGPTVEEREHVEGFQQAYAELYSKARHTVVKPGDSVPIAELDWRIVSSAAEVLDDPLPGGGQPNPYCDRFEPRENTSGPENGQSVGSVVTYGEFRVVDLGDLLWNNERDLMCPNNPIGTVDLYLTSHHGLDQSGSEVLVHALQPRVAITQNGTRKGASEQTFRTLHSSPNLEDLWQLHWSHNGRLEFNPAGVFIANIEEPATIATILTTPSPAPSGAGRAPDHTGPGHWIKVSARSAGTFTVTNSRNGFSKTYSHRDREERP
ncbi:MAG: MBL fold metallo-hydrolase [Luteitalea sp.]|nr:MBL fold metallo-hydrolase [Luteitalea sp.]